MLGSVLHILTCSNVTPLSDCRYKCYICLWTSEILVENIKIMQSF